VACGRRTRIVGSQKDGGCPGVEIEVDVPRTEKDSGGRELEMNRASGVAPPSMLPVEKRFHVCIMPVPTFLPGLVYQPT